MDSIFGVFFVTVNGWRGAVLFISGSCQPPFLSEKWQQIFSQKVETGTLPESNIAPENGPLEKEIPIGNHHF